jgi:UDP-glucuronate 4-epimerase
MDSLRGEKILVTGPAGQIAFPLAARLAGDNEVWGIARFRDRHSRDRVEAAGIRTRVVDLAAPDWADLPDDFSVVLHLAAAIPPGHDYDASLRVNAEGTGHLMSRFRKARACLVMSTCGVYASPEDSRRAIMESDSLGGSPQPYSPTYCVSKIGEEAVARFAAREFGLPTTIARMNVAYGDNGGLPAILFEMILAEQSVPLLAGRAAVCSPIHEDDIFDHTPGLLTAASIPATITNWGGDEAVEIPALCRYMADLVGKQATFIETPHGIHHYRLDPTRRAELAGRCRVPWRDGVRRMIAARHPELALRA